MHDLYEKNGWQTQWIVRYGNTQRSHYHGDTHECMTVLKGSAKIRFGVADTTEDMDGNTYGGMHEDGGITLAASAGDVFILPAGLAHKTYDTLPAGELKLLTPGKGEGVEADDPRKALAELVLDGFTMMGSYPFGGKWNFAVGGEDKGNFERVWKLDRPLRDPVLGESKDGLCGIWDSAIGLDKSSKSRAAL